MSHVCHISMSHGSHINESCMSHINESWLTYQWVMYVLYQWVMSHITSETSHINESCESTKRGRVMYVHVCRFACVCLPLKHRAVIWLEPSCYLKKKKASQSTQQEVACLHTTNTLKVRARSPIPSPPPPPFPPIPPLGNRSKREKKSKMWRAWGPWDTRFLWKNIPKKNLHSCYRCWSRSESKVKDVSGDVHSCTVCDVWHVSVICVTWLINMWHDSSICDMTP